MEGRYSRDEDVLEQPFLLNTEDLQTEKIVSKVEKPIRLNVLVKT